MHATTKWSTPLFLKIEEAAWSTTQCDLLVASTHFEHIKVFYCQTILSGDEQAAI
jgi:hypothetical protein